VYLQDCLKPSPIKPIIGVTRVQFEPEVDETFGIPRTAKGVSEKMDGKVMGWTEI
jgi:hypothetical protein